MANSYSYGAPSSSPYQQLWKTSSSEYVPQGSNVSTAPTSSTSMTSAAVPLSLSSSSSLSTRRTAFNTFHGNRENYRSSVTNSSRQQLVSTPRQKSLAFVLVALHSDPAILYNEDRMGLEEAEDRAKQSLIGLTVTAIDYTNIRHVRYNGLCLRGTWNPLNNALFRTLKSTLVYRDKCCNQRNFTRLIPAIYTKANYIKKREPAYDCDFTNVSTTSTTATTFGTATTIGSVVSTTPIVTTASTSGTTSNSSNNNSSNIYYNHHRNSEKVWIRTLNENKITISTVPSTISTPPESFTTATTGEIQSKDSILRQAPRQNNQCTHSSDTYEHLVNTVSGNKDSNSVAVMSSSLLSSEAQYEDVHDDKADNDNDSNVVPAYKQLKITISNNSENTVSTHDKVISGNNDDDDDDDDDGIVEIIEEDEDDDENEEDEDDAMDFIEETEHKDTNVENIKTIDAAHDEYNNDQDRDTHSTATAAKNTNMNLWEINRCNTVVREKDNIDNRSNRSSNSSTGCYYSSPTSYERQKIQREQKESISLPPPWLHDGRSPSDERKRIAEGSKKQKLRNRWWYVRSPAMYYDGTRSMPEGTLTLQSFYRYDCNVPEKLRYPLIPNVYLTGLAGPSCTLDRYGEFYRRLVHFILNETSQNDANLVAHSREQEIELPPIIVYHKLPLAIANWLINDLRNVCPRLQFKFLGKSVSARWAYTSPHCRFRTNHNVCMCEICLIDEYGAQLITCLTNNESNIP